MKPRQYNLYTIIALPLAGSMLLFAAVLLWWTYSGSLRAINSELTSSFEQRHVIVDQIIENNLIHIDQGLRELSRALDISSGITWNDADGVKTRLREMVGVLHDPPLDILFVRLKDGSIFADASSPFFNVSAILPELSQKLSPALNRGGVVTAGGQTMLLTTEPLEDARTGRSLGSIVGAVILNDNLAFLENIGTSTYSQEVALLAGGELIGSTAPKEGETVRTLISGAPDFLDAEDAIILDAEPQDGLVVGFIPIFIEHKATPLILAVSASDEALVEIRQSYRATIYAVLLFTALFIVFAIRLVRKTTYPSFRRLLEYSKEISDEKLDATYDHGSIREVNDIGGAMVDMVEKLRRSRLLIRNVIDSMPSALIGVDTAGTVTQWNQEAEELFGITVNDAVGHPLALAIPRLSKEMTRVKEAIATRQEFTELKQSSDPDGEARYEDVTIYPLIANGVEGAVIRIDDVTERVNLEKMMVQSEKMLSVGGLAAGMAHEINNPLAAILGYSFNIQKRVFSDLKKNHTVAEECGVSLDDVREYLTQRSVPKMLDGIHESGERAAKIVSNMLSFSRKSEKRFAFHHMATLLDKTLDLAANDYDLKKHYDFRQISIVREYDPSVPAVHCEGNEMQQVFLNLLKNGAEAMGDKDYSSGGPLLICKVRREGDMAVVEIEDNGPGMSESVRNRVFEPFYTTKEVDKGTGLGLSVSYFIVTDQHNGKMEVHSIPGVNTRFIIKLPIEG
ncbi:MAG: ATP-binding protein [Pseudodesulfovibrio sp.]